MGLFDRFRSPVSSSQSDMGAPQMVDFRALMESNSIDLVEINDGAILVVEAPSHAFNHRESRETYQKLIEPWERSSRTLADPDAQDLQMNLELGRSSTSWSQYLRDDYNPELRGQSGLIKYDRMRRSDAAIRSSLRTLKTPILGADWFVQPHDETKEARDKADFVWHNLTQYMTYSWTTVLWEALLMLDFGFWIHEKVWKFKTIEGKQMVILSKMAPRHPLDVVDWIYDQNGGPSAVDFYSSPGSADHRRIPIEKLAIFTFDGEGGDLAGLSVLRSAYKHWYFRENFYKIDAIQKERHGIGIPVIKLPPNFNDTDKLLAKEMGQNLRANEKAYITLPPNWEILFAKLEGQAVDSMQSAEHHTRMIYQNVLAQAAYIAAAGGDADTMMELFYKSTRYIADLVRNVMNKYVIP